MKHILILSNDSRSVGQISSRVSELKEEASIEVFRNLEDFENFVSPPKDEDAPKKTASTITDDKKHSLYVQALIKEKGLHLVVVDQELLGRTNPVNFIHKLRDKLASSDLHKADVQTRYFLLSFESVENSMEALASPLIDDVILKPIDNQLFLQKLSMILSEKRSAAGEFLYKQEVDANIYIAKTSMIEEMSELGIAIRSKKSIKDGVTIRIFAKVFGEKVNSSLLVRTFKSVPHPTVPAEFNVYYTYYGITSVQLQKVRRTLQEKKRKIPPQRALSAVEVQIFKKNRKNIAIVVFNTQMRGDIENALSANFINANLNSFPSLITLAKKLGVLPQSGDADKGKAPIAVDANGEMIVAFKADVFIFTINHADEMINIQNKSTSLFDMNLSQLMAGPKKWLQYIHPDDSEETIEFLNYLKSNDKGQIFIRMKSPANSIHYIKMEASEMKSANPPQVRIQLSELKGDDGFKAWTAGRPETGGQSPAGDIDAVLIDASGITQTVESWASYVKAFLENTKLISPDRRTPVIALLPEKASNKLEGFKKTFFSDVIITPLERKYLIDKVNFHVHGLYSENGLITPAFDPVNEEVRVAQEVKMEMASEFGVQIRSNQPIREGIFLRLFSPLFLDENYDGILARSYSAKPDDKNRSEFHNVFSFFGISDAFLKHIRKWIREAHIAQKDPNKE